jgi:hypothetical protein
LGCDESKHGAFLMMEWMSECEKPLSLKKLITELGFSGDLKRTRLLLKALRAD